MAATEGEETVNLKVLQKISEGNMKFTLDIYKAVSKKEGNIFVSPFSVEVVLALAYMGARGRTADEIASALGLPPSRDDTRSGFRSIISSLEDLDNVTLDIANKVFTMENYEILQEFSQIAEKDFFSGAEELDFSDGESSRKVINDWVEEKTKNKIKDLIPSGVLNSLTRLVLVNALYFKGKWEKQFKSEKTKPEKFFLNSNNHKMIPMMTQKAKFGYMESDTLDAKILKMSYMSSENLSMFVLLPNKIDGISELEQKLTNIDISRILNHMEVEEVIVTIPKFKLEEKIDFDEILQELGMATMYDIREADFSGISGKNELFVSKVLQKTFIDVNEEGTEAAAATAMRLRLKTAPRAPAPPRQFFVDHPFVFIIRSSDILLFAGRFSNPL